MKTMSLRLPAIFVILFLMAQLGSLYGANFGLSPDQLHPTNAVSNYVSQATDSDVSSPEIRLSWGVLLFGAFIILLEFSVMLRLKKGWGTNSIRITGISLVVIAGLFLIVAGYSQNQIAPMMGLLGTIAGFLMGKTDNKPPASET